MTGVNIRVLGEEDWSEFIRLEQEAFSGDETNREGFVEKCDEEGFVGLFVNSQLAGYLYLSHYDDYGHLNRIATHQDYRGQGHGTTLMEFAVTKFKEWEVEKVGIYVETDNTPAINLYQKFGFEISFESWHYIIDIDKYNTEIKPGVTIEKELRPITEADLTVIEEKYPAVSIDQMREQFKREEQKDEKDLYFLGLYETSNSKDDGELVLFSRFSPSFSGSMPFEFDYLDDIDQFIVQIQQYMEEEKDYIRLTFDNSPELAELFEERGNTLHHHMYKLFLNI